MNSLEFLKAILPDNGIYFLGIMQAGRHGVAHKSYTSIEDMAAAAAKYDAAPNITVYHALAAYKEKSVTVGDKVKYRTADNVSHLKTFWADMDCGTEKAAAGKGYPDKTTAAKAMVAFCNASGFPRPMFVDSGNGLHAYWPLTEAIGADEWRDLAAKLKSIFKTFGLLADPSRTSDASSILRPVGTHNKKDPSNPKEVKAKSTVAPIRPMDFVALIATVVSNYGVICESVVAPKESKPRTINDDFLDNIYPKKHYDAELVRENCQQVQAMFAGSKGYDHWRGVIGIVSFCGNPKETAHKWSSSTADAATQYDPAETEQKLHTWNSPPTTCAFFETHNPGGCAGCKFKGTVTTPLQLGVAVIQPEAEIVDAKIDDEVVKVEIPEFPYGYHYDDNARVMIREMKNKDGVVEQFRFSPIRFYPTTRIQQPDGTFSLMVRMHLPDGRLRDFQMPMYIALAGGAPLKQELGKYEIAMTNNKDADGHVSAYLRDSVLQLMNTSREMNTMTRFGWRDDMKSFLIGDRLYSEDGTIHRVILGGSAVKLSSAFPNPAKDTAGWVEGVDKLYNRENMEPMQYTLCSAFGSILTPFIGDQYFGIPVALTGSESGRGKTTCCRAALAAFGMPNDMEINGAKGATNNFRMAMMGAMNNVPILIDEITQIKSDELGDLMYAASNGRGRGRLKMTGSGAEMADSEKWAMSLYLTANKALSHLLAAEKLNSEAEAVRFIEIKTDDYNIPSLDTVLVSTAVQGIRDCVGSVGAKFVQYVVTHKRDITKLLQEIAEQVQFSSEVAQSPQYRYYRYHVVCTLAACSVLEALELVAFDIDRLFTWTIAHVEKMCAEVVEFNRVTPEDAFNRMVNDMRPLIIATVGCKSGINGQIDLSVPTMHQAPVGRYIAAPANGQHDPLSDRLYLSSAAVREWCLKQRVDPNDIVDYLRDANALIDIPSGRFYLGRGTINSVGQVRCYCIDTKRLRQLSGELPALSVVQTGETA